ncbi:MAG: sigma-70 family RNA polymerase sigma factor [Woeseiaceae bacterium]|nr:sigma-70 family RNA polymerase sigma factor [Woeseiaceae bacterium]
MAQESNEQLLKLLSRTAAGDRRAFNRLYDKTSPYLFAIAIRMVHRRPAAEDVLQDAYVQVWHRAGDYHAQRGSVLGWMTALVRYRAIDLLRKNRNGTPFDEDAPIGAGRSPDSGNPDDSAMMSAAASEDTDFLNECVSRLSGSQRQSIALAFFQGLTHAELAQRLTLPLGTIKSRLRRGLKRLKQCLDDLGYSNELHT